jgi:hypothetical protein
LEFSFEKLIWLMWSHFIHSCINAFKWWSISMFHYRCYLILCSIQVIKFHYLTTFIESLFVMSYLLLPYLCLHFPIVSPFCCLFLLTRLPLPMPKRFLTTPSYDVFFPYLFNLSISYMGINVLLILTISNFQKIHLNWKMKNYKHYKHLYMKGRLVGKDVVDQWILNQIFFMYNILMHDLIQWLLNVDKKRKILKSKPNLI